MTERVSFEFGEANCRIVYLEMATSEGLYNCWEDGRSEDERSLSSADEEELQYLDLNIDEGQISKK